MNIVSHCVVNDYRSSNTYILEAGKTEVVIVDPGGIDSKQLELWLELNKKIPRNILLTHEHPDHCMGVNKLRVAFNSNIICSEKCAKNIQSAKLNYSLYSHEIEAFAISGNFKVLTDFQKIKVGNLRISLIETPGHSPGSACFLIDEKFLFSGDTLLNGSSIPLNLPHSSKTDYETSFSRIKDLLKPSTIVYPGHGKPFEYKNLNSR